MSQAAFAHLYDLPLDQLRQWEKGAEPDATARVVLMAIKANPHGMAVSIARHRPQHTSRHRPITWPGIELLKLAR